MFKGKTEAMTDINNVVTHTLTQTQGIWVERWWGRLTTL